MNLILLLIVLFLLFSGGGYYGYNAGMYTGAHYGGGLVFILLLAVLVFAFG